MQDVLKSAFSYFLNVVVLFLFLIGASSFAGPIGSLIFDVEGTIVQNEQDYEYTDGKPSPLLKEISGSWTDSNGKTHKFKYYLKLGVEDLFRQAVAQQKDGHLESGFSALTFMPQAKLNAVLRAIKVDGVPLIDLVNSAYGSEAIAAYSKLVRPDEKIARGKKDLGIFTQKINRQVWTTGLKNGDLSGLDKLAVGKISGPMTSVMIDDHPGEVVDLQKENVVKISRFFKRDAEFWKKYSFYSQHPLDTPQHAFEVQNFLALLEADRNMLFTVGHLLEDTRRTSTPNPYSEWTPLLSAQQTLGLDYAHFSFLLADLAFKDHPAQDILVLGRDSDLFNTALETTKKTLGLKSKTYYLEISRLVAQNEAHRLPEILKAAGIDVDAIVNGSRRLLIVDSNYNGSIPKAILKSLVADNDPNWREKVRRIRTWMFNPARTHSAPPESFATLNEYLINGAFIDRSIHQDRVGHDYMRMVTAYQDINRPKRNVRSIEADETGIIKTRASHPSEFRYAEILHQAVLRYYRKAANQALVLKRLNFLRGEPGDYPRMWSLNEPTVFPDPAIIKESDLGDVKNSAKSHHRFLLAAAEQFDNRGKNPPSFVPHHRLPKNEKEVEWHMYAPPFAKGEAIDLSQNFLDIVTLKPIYDLSAWPKLDPKTFQDIRQRSVQAMSRTAQGINGNAGKKMAKAGEEMAAVTMNANVQVGKYILEASQRNFSNAQELAQFIIDKINIPYVQELREIKNESAIWRTWAFQNEDQKKSGDFFARHSPLKIERDWLWFTEWLHKSMQQNYDPVDLSARVHYYLSNWVHPFGDGVGKTTRDIIDLLFMKKGLAPVDWTVVSFATYWESSGSIEGIRDVLLTGLEMHRKNSTQASGMTPPAKKIERKNVIPSESACIGFYR